MTCILSLKNLKNKPMFKITVVALVCYNPIITNYKNRGFRCGYTWNALRFVILCKPNKSRCYSLAGQFVAAFVFRVAGVALYPMEGNAVLFQQR